MQKNNFQHANKKISNQDATLDSTTDKNLLKIKHPLDKKTLKEENVFIDLNLEKEIIAFFKKVKFQKNSHPAQIFIVIDDFGYQLRQVELFLKLKKPITFAILPNLPQSLIISNTLKKEKKTTLLHLPMEAKSKKNLEKNTLFTTDDKAKIEAKIKQASYSVPYYSGINNHMGSIFTTNFNAMDLFMKYLKEKNLFFLDSKTAAGKTSLLLAKKYNIPYLSRDIFLDNSKNHLAITKQLIQTAKIAFYREKSIAIGHPYESTYQVLQILMPLLAEEGIQFKTIDKFFD